MAELDALTFDNVGHIICPCGRGWERKFAEAAIRHCHIYHPAAVKAADVVPEEWQ